MTDGTSSSGPGGAGRRARRIEETILEVDGVVAVRVWELAGRVEIGVVPSASDTPTDVVERVREVVESLREADEIWEVGGLNDHATDAPAGDADTSTRGR